MPADSIMLARKSHGSPISTATLDLLLPPFVLLLLDVSQSQVLQCKGTFDVNTILEARTNGVLICMKITRLIYTG